MKNPLWKTNPEEAKKGFEKELRQYIQFVNEASRAHGLIEDEPIEIKYRIYKEILGE